MAQCEIFLQVWKGLNPIYERSLQEFVHTVYRYNFNNETVKPPHKGTNTIMMGQDGSPKAIIHISWRCV